jgi:hypothetical protein
MNFRALRCMLGYWRALKKCFLSARENQRLASVLREMAADTPIAVAAIWLLAKDCRPAQRMLADDARRRAAFRRQTQ